MLNQSSLVSRGLLDSVRVHVERVLNVPGGVESSRPPRGTAVAQRDIEGLSPSPTDVSGRRACALAAFICRAPML